MKLLFKEMWHGFGGDGLIPALSPHICPDQIRLYHIQLSVWSLGFLRFFELLVEIFLSCLSCLSGLWGKVGAMTFLDRFYISSQMEQ